MYALKINKIMEKDLFYIFLRKGGSDKRCGSDALYLEYVTKILPR